MITPIGTILNKIDGALGSSLDSLSGLVANEVVAPLVLGTVILFAAQGIKTAKGDEEPMRNIVTSLLSFGIVFWLITSPDTYLYYARMVLIGTPARLVSAISGNGTGLAAATTIPASLDMLWGQVWHAAAMVGETATFDWRGGIQILAGLAMAWFAGLALFVCGAVYAACSLLSVLIIVCGPLLIASWPFPPLRHIALAWKGIAISLVLAQVLTFITMQIVILAGQSMMVDIVNALIASFLTPGTAVEALVGLAAMGGLLWTCAGTITAVPIMTFFMGRGGSAPTQLAPIR